MLVKFGLVQKCLDSLKSSGCEFAVFDKVMLNPPSELVEQGFDIYKQEGCDSIIAFGGGSPMDTAKVIGAKVQPKTGGELSRCLPSDSRWLAPYAPLSCCSDDSRHWF